MEDKYKLIITNDLLRLERSKSDIDFIINKEILKNSGYVDVCENYIYISDIISLIENRFMDKVRAVTYAHLIYLQRELQVQMKSPTYGIRGK